MTNLIGEMEGMNFKLLVVILIGAVLNFSIGCYSVREIYINKNENVKISKIILKDGIVVDFTNDSLGYAYYSNDEILRIKSNGEQETYPLNNVSKIYTKKFDSGKTFWFLVGTSLGITLIYVAIILITLPPQGLGA